MIISHIHIDGFGKLHGLDLDLKPGINIISGANESGKSTLHLFLRSMLYGCSTARENGGPSVYERMRPWGHASSYGGSIEVIRDEITYRLLRDFGKAPDDLGILDLSKGEEVFNKEGFMEELLCRLSETAFLNTISAGQLTARTDKSMAGEVRKYAQNISATANPKLSADKALKYLDQKENSLNAALRPDAAADYNTLLVKGRELQKSLGDPTRENRISEYSRAKKDTEIRASDTAMSISNEEMYISKKEDHLLRFDIRDEKDIDDLKSTADQYYQKQKRLMTTSLVLLILGACLLVAAIFLMPSDFYSLPLLDFRVAGPLSLGVAGIVLLIIGITELFRRNSARKSLLKLIDKQLDEDTADTSVTGHNMTGDGTPDAAVSENSIADDDTLGAAADVPDGSAAEREADGRVPEDTGSSRRMTLQEKMEAFSRKLGEREIELSTLIAGRKRLDGLMETLKGLNDETKKYETKLSEQTRIQSGVEMDIIELDSTERRLRGLERTISENKALRDELDAISIARETLKDLSEGIKKSVGTYINKEAGQMLKGLTSGAYISLDAGRDYEIAVNTPGGFIPFEALSRGTIDQIYLAIRLSTIRFMTGGGDHLPLLLDDSFVLFDDGRLRGALQFLSENYKGQMLIFSCQNREERMLKGLGAAFHGLKL